MLQVDADWSVPVDSGQMLAGHGLLGVFQQSVLQSLPLYRMRGGQHFLNRADLSHEAHGCLLAHSRHARDVVGHIAHQSLEIRYQFRPEPVFRAHFFGAVLIEFGYAAPREHHPNAVGDQLQSIAVARYDKRLIPSLVRHARQGADDIIGLPAVQLDHGETESPGRLAHYRHLSPERFVHRLSGRLVILVLLMPEGGRRPVEGADPHVRLLLLQELGHHVAEPQHRVGGRAVGPGECGRQGMESPVGQAVAVYDQDLARLSFRQIRSPSPVIRSS